MKETQKKKFFLQLTLILSSPDQKLIEDGSEEDINLDLDDLDLNADVSAFCLVCVICLTTNAHCWLSWNMAVTLIAAHWVLLLDVVSVLQVD